jgi:hypothetical protein
MVLYKLIACNAQPVLAALHDGVGSAAVRAEFAVRAALVAFVALVALRASEVLVVVFGKEIIGADVVRAVFVAILALVAVLAKFRLVEAVAAVHTKMLFPVVAFGTEAVLAVIVLLTFFAEQAVLTLHVVWTLHAIGAEMVIEVGREDAVAMRAVFVLAVLLAALLAEAAFVALLNARAFRTSFALRAKPVVFLAAVGAVVAIAQASP